jgi:hypothetical protein
VAPRCLAAECRAASRALAYVHRATLPDALPEGPISRNSQKRAPFPCDLAPSTFLANAHGAHGAIPLYPSFLDFPDPFSLLSLLKPLSKNQTSWRFDVQLEMEVLPSILLSSCLPLSNATTRKLSGQICSTLLFFLSPYRKNDNF